MTLTDIHQAIEQTSERRTELWHALSQGHDPAVAAELKRLSEQLQALWDEERNAKAVLRFGAREPMVAPARVKERPDRAANRPVRPRPGAPRRPAWWSARTRDAPAPRRGRQPSR